jgi:uncharacterized membrane protein
MVLQKVMPEVLFLFRSLEKAAGKRNNYMLINQMLILTALTFLPLFELRFSIPVAILSGSVDLPLHLKISGFGWSWPYAFAFCVFINIILGPIVFFLLDVFTRYCLHIAFFAKMYDFFVRRTQKRVEKYISNYGTLGVALFIGVPLPGSGSYSGALGAYILGLTPWQFLKANILGVIIAGILVTFATVTGEGIFKYFFG